MGSGSSARYAAKKENVEPDGNSGIQVQPTPDVKHDLPEIRVTAPTKRSPSPHAPVQRSPRPRSPRPGSPRPESEVPGNETPRPSPRAALQAASKAESGHSSKRTRESGHGGSKRQSLGQTLQTLEQTRILDQTRSPRSPKSPGEPGERLWASEGNATDINPQAHESRRRASWYVEPPPPPGPPAKDVMDELSELYPARQFEITAFACLPGLRPGMGVTLGDCAELPSLNDTTGSCGGYDSVHHVWTVQFDDGRMMRVIPTELVHATLNADGEKKKCIKCCIAYGDDLGILLIDREMQKRRWVSFAADIPPPPKPRPKPVPVVEPTFEPEPAKPVVVQRQTEPQAAPSRVEVPEIKEDFEGYRTGDLVTFMEARGLGVGKVVGEGKSAGEVLVQFGKGSHIYSLETAHLEKVKKSKSTEMKRRKSIS